MFISIRIQKGRNLNLFLLKKHQANPQFKVLLHSADHRHFVMKTFEVAAEAIEYAQIAANKLNIKLTMPQDHEIKT